MTVTPNRTATPAKLALNLTGGRVPTHPVTVYERRDGRLVGRADAQDHDDQPVDR